MKTRTALTTFVAAAASLLVAQGSAVAATAHTPLAVAKDGAKVVKITPVDAHMIDLTIASPALHMTGKVRLVLPADWFSQPKAKWPTLYMLEGAGEPKDYTSWTAFTNFETFMANKDVLSVLPTDGLAGFTSSEVDGGPNYDKFTAVEVPQILARAFRSDGVHNAVAGISIGGLGAIDLAANHPGEFAAAASYSGLLDTQLPGVPALIADTRSRDNLSYLGMWGDPVKNRAVWDAHDPAALVGKLKNVRVFVSNGNGQVGPLDNPSNLPPLAGYLEQQTYTTSQAFIAAATTAGLTTTTDLTAADSTGVAGAAYHQAHGSWPIETDFYGPGTHTWPYWQVAFQASWPMLAAGLGVPGS